MLCAVSNMRFIDFLIGNIGLLPCDIPVIYVGASMNDLSQVGSGTSTNPINLVVMGVGLVVVIIVIGLVSFYANWEMKRSIKGLDDPKEK